ncbi:hypothetical protein TNCT_717551 [Trichonephila clavata]|uniref:Uncharacterized protein n=1 Tax=Trichonephila clavata TaxID=2740835 RepID=A0A8X6GZU9_TRICU|nr:hypothetical protein TNCT_717551 [Trichonephila clavata]
MRRAAKNDTRAPSSGLSPSCGHTYMKKNMLASLIAKSCFGQSQMSTVHQHRYGGWTCSTIGAGRFFC